MYNLNNNTTCNAAWVFILLSCFTTLQAQQFTITSYQDKSIDQNNISSFITKESSRLNQHRLEKKTDETIQSLILLSQLSRANKNYANAFNYAGEALFLAEEANQPKLLYHAHQEYGLLNYLFKQDNAAGINLKAALKHAREAYNQNIISHQDLYPAYYHWLLYNQRIENLEEMKANIDTCYWFVEKYNMGIEKELYLKEKAAFIHYRTNREERAIELLNEANAYISSQESLSQHQSFLIVIYGVMANNLYLMKRNDEAIDYFEKALNINDTYGEHTFYLEYLHTLYADILNQQGNSQAAFYHMKKGKSINDTYLNPRKDASQGFLSIKDRYLEEFTLRNNRLSKQELEIEKQKSKLWKMQLILIALSLMIVIVGFIIRLKRQKEKHQTENTAFLERRKHNETLIAHKKKELTSNMLQLVEKEEIIKQLSDILKKELPSTKTKTLLKSIEQQSASLWEDFNHRFMAQNEDFYKNLKEKAPNLSQADLKICALIKLNFSGKEMAHLLGISEGSVHVARHRLRKKLNLDRDNNLTQFINNL